MEAENLSELERAIRRNVLLGLIAEMYERRLSDVISVKEWLEAKLRERVEEEEQPRCTNHYLCAQDQTRWDSGWSCMCNDRCPTCDTVTEPYAMTNADESEMIHDREVYNRANVIGQ
jgi:hypothetical protein